MPHFEKMLYDQAQLVLAYVEAAQLTGDRFFAEVAIDTLDYVRRDLTDPGGGFYSAEDADSVPPEQAERSAPAQDGGRVLHLARRRDSRRARARMPTSSSPRYGVRPDGNAPFDPQNEFTHKNLLYTARPIEDIAATTGLSVDEVEASLQRSREALRARRSTRPRPHLDDKVLTAWNGLMIAAFARAARVLDEGGAVPGRCAAGGGVRPREALEPGDADAAAAIPQGRSRRRRLCRGLRVSDLRAARAVSGRRRSAVARMGAGAAGSGRTSCSGIPIEGGWFSTTGKDASVLLRLKEDYDGAEPAASSIGVLNLLTLAHLSPEPNEPRAQAKPRA